ncbi:hypothetical protein STA1M1_33030 [Sinisalibacter aestuarii]|uniref:Uncharacterized protein n=1 Tax=Sinisalibacter aestuarii TaxID=2949426 RepID=A0ABQ5LWS6_9RHOB|nr:hypothetical protein STA1M1_33030 [Sinisalibacter aestuarii]
MQIELLAGCERQALVVEHEDPGGILKQALLRRRWGLIRALGKNGLTAAGQANKGGMNFVHYGIAPDLACSLCALSARQPSRHGGAML